MKPPRWIAREFPVARTAVLLDNASAAPLPMAVTRAMSRHVRRWSHEPQSQLELDGIVNSALQRAATLMDVAAENVSFIPSVTAGVSFLARGLHLEREDIVIVPDDEYPATLLPWKEAERQGGARVVRTSAQEEVIEHALASERVRVLSLSAVGWLGYRYDVERLARACRSRGVLLLLDLSQSCGLYDFKVATDTQFASVTSFSKWAFAPEGIACLSVSTDVVHRLDPVLTGVEACEFDASHTSTCLLPRHVHMPLRLYGVSPILACGLDAALAWSAAIDRAGARAWVEQLVADAETQLSAAGFVVASRTPEHRSGILLFCSPETGANERVVARLREQSIYVQERAGWIRASFHFYNRTEDVQRLIDALCEQ
jgi:cysteine desulfurase / selenocysteine lyase